MSGIAAWIAFCETQPELLATLRPGLSAAELDAAELALDRRLPEAFRALYLWRDGADESAWDATFCRDYRLFTLAEGLRRRLMWDEIARDRHARGLTDEAGPPLGRVWLPFAASDYEIFALALDPDFGLDAGFTARFDFKGGSHWIIDALSLDALLGTLARIGEAGFIRKHFSEFEVEALHRPLHRVRFGDMRPLRAVVTFAPGETVELIRGTLAGQRGRVLSVDGDWVDVELTLFGKLMRHSVSVHDLRR